MVYVNKYVCGKLNKLRQGGSPGERCFREKHEALGEEAGAPRACGVLDAHATGCFYGKYMKVNEIFYSLQGESSYAGWPCAFIRLTGCDLRCTYCDTQYAFYDGTDMSIPEILQAIDAYPTRLVLVTGGEPMLQESVYELFEKLFEKGYTVLLETGGQISLEKLDRRVHKIVDFKCPSSGMGSHNFYQNVQYLTQKDELKFVIGDRNDFNWACALIREHDLTSLVDVIAFSPVFEKLPYSELANWVLHCGLRVRLQVQLHKIIWPDIPRGV